MRYVENYEEERQKADFEPKLELAPSDDLLRQESAKLEKLFLGPTAVKVDAKGMLYIADSGRHRIQVYRKEPTSSAGAIEN